jgi:hypothetical protein
MNFKNLLWNNEDSINSGLRFFLNFTSDVQTNKTKFLNSNKELSNETVNQYFNQYRELHNYAGSELVKIRQNFGDTEITRQKFVSAISVKHKWINNENINRLFKICEFQNR